MRVFMIGFMGVGKTTVGRELARISGARFFDLDEEIERHAGLQIREIFERHGEEEFRRLERERLREVSLAEDVVVATGGGCFAEPGNREWIGRSGVSVWLDMPLEAILDRLSDHGRLKRPLLASPEDARSLYERRRPSYALADLKVEVSGTESPAGLAAAIVRLLRETKCGT